MNHITLTAADSISYPEFPGDYFAVPNDRIGTCLRDGEGLIRDGKMMKEVPLKEFLSETAKARIDGWDKAGREIAEPSASKALTYDDGKPPLALLPPAALREIGLVQAYGQKKYGDAYNYLSGMEVNRNVSCALRHIFDYLGGVDVDKESHAHHLAHAACRLMFTLQNIKDGTATDDRFDWSKIRKTNGNGPS